MKGDYVEHMKFNQINEKEKFIRVLADTPVRSRPVLRQGSTGEWVSQLQRYLTQLTYYNGAIDGNFGATTNTAVRAFQQNNRLLVDGIVGINTWSALIYLYSPLPICGGESIGVASHTVVAGETLFSLAGRFNTSVDELMRYNNLTSANLRLGQILRIPGTSGSSNPGITIPPANRPTLRQGDRGDAVTELQSLLISLGYNTGGTTGIFGPLTNTAVRNFQRDQNLNVDGIVGPITWGALINVSTPPVTPPTENTTYTVVSGDTLWGIAKRFNTTVDAITRINNLTGAILNVGQQLLIPNSESPIIYTVVSGDTLFSIARRFNTTANEIMSLNNMTTNVLRVGQQILIPA